MDDAIFNESVRLRNADNVTAKTMAEMKAKRAKLGEGNRKTRRKTASIKKKAAPSSN